VADRDDITPKERGVPGALIGAVVLAAVVLIFIFQNTNRITIHFLWFTRDAQVWAALLVTSAVAIGAAELFAVYLRHRRND
jgi:uncharacterized integral membrane protein